MAKTTSKDYYDSRNYPFRTLKHKIAYIKRSGVTIGNMFSEEGNKALKNAIQKVVDFILDDEKRLNRKKAIDMMVVEWKKVHAKHKEAYDTDVKESVLWYIDSCLEHRGKKEVTHKEIKNLYEE